jgi:preprotein translocase SecE subunit
LFWNVLNLDAGSYAAKLLVATGILAAVVALLVLGVQLLGKRAPHGARAGIFVGVVGVLAILLLTRWASIWFEHWAYTGSFTVHVGIGLTAAVGVVLLLVGGYYFLSPKFEPYLIKIEDQGWFSISRFKPQQGFRVRAGTVLGIMIIVVAGLWSMISHGTLNRLPVNWELNIPFTGKTTVDLVALFGYDKSKETPESEVHAAWSAKPKPERPSLEQMVLDYVKEAAKNEKGEGLDPERFLAWKLARTFNVSGPNLVVDRYALRDFNTDLANSVKVMDTGDSSDLKEFAVFDKSKVEKEVSRLKAEKRPEPTFSALPPVSGPETFATVELLPLVQYTLLFILAAVAAWLSWRIVNYPAFADFLIATEAELNKVSWTTRKKLVQDTIVVLITVLLVAVYLFAMDQAWHQLLSWGPIHIIQIQKEPTENKSVENKPW